jgi:hypothetical protein
MENHRVACRTCKNFIDRGERQSEHRLHSVFYCGAEQLKKFNPTTGQYEIPMVKHTYKIPFVDIYGCYISPPYGNHLEINKNGDCPWFILREPYFWEYPIEKNIKDLISLIKHIVCRKKK